MSTQIKTTHFGNQAIIVPDRTLDPRLCVPAFQQVCHCRWVFFQRVLI